MVSGIARIGIGQQDQLGVGIFAQHPAVSDHTGHKARIKAGADFIFPDPTEDEIGYENLTGLRASFETGFSTVVCRQGAS